MIFYTGDIHGNNTDIIEFCKMHELAASDVVVLLGDVGANYYTGKRDRKMKEAFAKVAPTFLCIHGNHEMRPDTIDTYKQREWNSGIVWYEEEFPNLLFAKDGEIYEILRVEQLSLNSKPAFYINEFFIKKFNAKPLDFEKYKF
ncbi:MAG: metallophosphoesterase [Ruminococcaceae bacterium]|nr:metallophosphoesterase [Oscillospiraceae bacterium]